MEVMHLKAYIQITSETVKFKEKVLNLLILRTEEQHLVLAKMKESLEDGM